MFLLVLSLAVAFESEWKRYSSSQSDEKMSTVWIQLHTKVISVFLIG